MGLLDDAIREHLELKRQHGADPAEVARQEREVLGAGRAPVADTAPPVADAPAPPPDTAAPPHDGEPGRDPFTDVEASSPPPAAGRGEPAGAISVERFAPEPDLDWSDPAPLDDPAPVPPDEPEDVLEETPEFLEETPEHDRLWFEQRPPKDFDF